MLANSNIVHISIEPFYPIVFITNRQIIFHLGSDAQEIPLSEKLYVFKLELESATETWCGTLQVHMTSDNWQNYVEMN